MQVWEVMKRNVFTVTPEMPAEHLSRELMQRAISGAPVVDSRGELIGVVSLADLNAGPRFHRDLWLEEGEMEPFTPGAVVKDLMSSKAFAVPETANVRDLARMMLQNEVHRVIVVNASDEVVGIVTSLDLVELVSVLLPQPSALVQPAT